MATIGRALRTPSTAPAPQSSRLSASSVRRRRRLAPERGADGEFAFAADGARENQIGDVGAGDDEDEHRRGEQHQQDGPGARGDLVAQADGVDAEVGFGRSRLRDAL